MKAICTCAHAHNIHIRSPHYSRVWHVTRGLLARLPCTQLPFCVDSHLHLPTYIKSYIRAVLRCSWSHLQANREVLPCGSLHLGHNKPHDAWHDDINIFTTDQSNVYITWVCQNIIRMPASPIQQNLWLQSLKREILATILRSFKNSGVIYDNQWLAKQVSPHRVIAVQTAL